MVPVFLSKHKEKVLHSGKYLNVIRECGKDVTYPWPEHENMFLGGNPVVPISESPAEDEEMKEENAEEQRLQGGGKFDFFEPIEKAYEWSSQ